MRFLFLLLLIPLLTFSQTTEQSLNKSDWRFRKKGDKEWLPAIVPGTVHTDLLNNQLIPDPFYGDNEKQLQWIENEDWEYKTVIEISKSELAQAHIELQFDGLDTYAKVYLNDSLILSADNMFRNWNIDVKKLLHKGENTIYILFESAVKKGKAEAKKLPYTLPGEEKVFTRKAQYQYGWDWGPRFVTCGIYKDVKLIFWNHAKIENVQYVQNKLTSALAELEFDCKIKCDSFGDYNLSALQYLIGKPSDAARFTSNKKVFLRKGINVVSIKHKINDPRLWWSNGLGDAVLYPFTISISQNDVVLDEKDLNIGLRTIELVQQKDSVGSSFYFKLNGVPVFMKGANYIPPDNFLPRVTKSDYENIVQNAVNANMNMLRVWGGGAYADDAFYNACDKKGILVWQDFMFACAMYPGDDAFINTVGYEVREQIERLRNHPCLALWCGNNEVDEGWKNWGWQKQFNYSPTDSMKIENDYDILFNTFIKQILLMYDAKCPYIASSPQIGWGHKESLQQGDSHYWGVWWGMEPFDIYKKKVGRFMSEYGFQGMPSVNTLKKFTANTDLNFDSPSIKNHQKHPTGYETIKTYMKRDYKVPMSFENYIYVSQLLQAEGMKTSIEAHRRAKPYCMGSLYWQLNDCWGVTSWSSIDYYGNWKAAHYQAKRSFEDVIVSINEEDNQYKIFVVSDYLQKKNGVLDLKLIDFSGKILFNKTSDVSINANSSNVYFSIEKKEFDKFDYKHIFLSASLKVNDDDDLKTAYYYFVKPKDLELTKPSFFIKPIDATKFEITSTVFAKDVFINYTDARLSDNYFDLLPNQPKIITIVVGKSLLELNGSCYKSGNNLKVSVKSLYDTFWE